MIVIRNKTFSKKKESKKESIKDRFTKLIEKGKEIQEEKRKNPRFLKPHGYGVDPIEASLIHQQHLQDHMTAVNMHNNFAHQAHMVSMGMM